MILFLDDEGILDIGIRQPNYKDGPAHPIWEIYTLADLPSADTNQYGSLFREGLLLKFIHVDIRALLLEYDVLALSESLLLRRFQQLKLKVHLQFERRKNQKNTIRYPRTCLNQKLDEILEDFGFVLAEVVKGKSEASLHWASLYDISLQLRRLNYMLIHQLAREFHPQFFFPHAERLQSPRSQ
jgi:hypothetical protein